MITKTELFRSNKIMCKSILRNSIINYFSYDFKTNIDQKNTSIVITLERFLFFEIDTIEVEFQSFGNDSFQILMKIVSKHLLYSHLQE